MSSNTIWMASSPRCWDRKFCIIFIGIRASTSVRPAWHCALLLRSAPALPAKSSLDGEPRGGAGREVELQPGCAQVLRWAGRLGVPCHVISVNWSSDLVRAALEPAALETAAPRLQDGPPQGGPPPPPGAPADSDAAVSGAGGAASPPLTAPSPPVKEGSLIVQCNDLELDQRGTATGRIVRWAGSPTHEPFQQLPP